MKLLPLMILPLLAGCGAAKELQPTAGHTLPVAPYGARTQPTAAQLVKPSPQARPTRTDELLKSPDVRRGDEFDLPPPN